MKAKLEVEVVQIENGVALLKVPGPWGSMHSVKVYTDALTFETVAEPDQPAKFIVCTFADNSTIAVWKGYHKYFRAGDSTGYTWEELGNIVSWFYLQDLQPPSP